MTIPPELAASVREPEFWARYTFAYADGPGADRLGDLDVEDAFDEGDDEGEGDGEDRDGEDSSVVVEFAVGGGYRLVLDIDVSLDSYELGILVPGAVEPAELGWDDLAHWHPFALRWSELERICGAVGVPEKGLALALLCRFVAFFEDDDVTAAAAAIDEAYADLRPAGWNGYWPRAADWLERADLRGQGVVWERDADGNLFGRQGDGHERDFYSLRGPETGRFPHAPLRALLNAAG
ncbi:hypothetical protein [Actinoplanes sp. NPDC051851]|uniref:hypothetical protein n=1 Tax=Actinoplanes sp. NPDC051851 TaxID=3154753 RepID=UPI00342F072A